MAVDIVQEIKQRTDLVELISQYVPLKQAGQAYKGLCPFHTEKSPSFTVNRERGLYKCFGCNESGDCFSFVQKREGLSFSEAGEVLARRLGLEWVGRGETKEQRSERQRLYDVCALAERFFRQQLAENREVQRYLTERGLTAGTIEQFGLGYAPPGYEALLGWLRREKVALEDAQRANVIIEGKRGFRDNFVDRVIFPIYDVEGRPVAFGGRTLQPDGTPKYLNSAETPIFHKGKTLYGLHLAKRAIPRSGFAVAVEGYMDLIALHQAGVDNSIAGLGTAITDSHVGILLRYSNQLVMCYDGDGAGIRAAMRNSSMFEKAGCDVRIAVLPQGDDPDTFIKQRGADAFRALLNEADPLLDYQLKELRRKFDLRNEQAGLPFIREAAVIIAQSGSHLVRQEYATKISRVLEQLAEEWFPGEPHRAMQARVALDQEIKGLLRSDRINGRGPSPAALPSVRAPAAPPSARMKAERYVLRAALSEYRWAEYVANWVAPECFSEGELKGIALRLLGNNPAEAALSAAERAEQIRLDPAVAELVSELLLDESPLNDEGLEWCIQVLEREHKDDRLRELDRAMKAGEISRDDPRWEEYLAIVALGKQRRED